MNFLINDNTSYTFLLLNAITRSIFIHQRIPQTKIYFQKDKKACTQLFLQQRVLCPHLRYLKDYFNAVWNFSSKKSH